MLPSCRFFLRSLNAYFTHILRGRCETGRYFILVLKFATTKKDTCFCLFHIVSRLARRISERPPLRHDDTDPIIYY